MQSNRSVPQTPPCSNPHLATPPNLQANLNPFFNWDPGPPLQPIADDDPVTEEELEILLNETIVGMPTPKQGPISLSTKQDLSPTSLMVARMIGGMESGKLLRVLFDSGGAATMIQKRALPPSAKISSSPEGKRYSTVAGPFFANSSVLVHDFIFPEFDRSKTVLGGKFKVFDAPECPHDVILGRDVLTALGVIINFDNGTVKWMEHVVKMKSRDHWRSSFNTTLALDANYLDVLDEDAFILDAKYEATTAREVAQAQKHLTKEQQDLLEKALANTDGLFDGKLGRYKAEEVHLEVEEGATPVHSRAYSQATRTILQTRIRTSHQHRSTELNWSY